MKPDLAILYEHPLWFEPLFAALGNLHFSEEELNGIDSYAQEGGIDLWSRSSSVTAEDIA